MKKTVSTVIFTFVLATLVMGQEEKKCEHKKMTTEERAEHRANKMAEELSLSAAQKESVKAINLAYAPKMQEIREKELTEEARIKEKTALRKAMRAEIETVLTDEQLALLKEKKKERRNHRKGHHHSEGHGCGHHQHEIEE